MKKFYKQNRVFVILMGIALICITIMGVVGINYLVSSTNKSVYGNRLDGISDIQIGDEKIKEMKNSVIDMKGVVDVDVLLHGKIVNFLIKFDKKTTNDEIKGTAVKCLEFFEEEYKNFYDIQFLMTKEYEESTKEEDIPEPILGYIKAGQSTISWSNNSK